MLNKITQHVMIQDSAVRSLLLLQALLRKGAAGGLYRSVTWA